MNEPFNNLMARYSGEAEIAKQQEEKATRRQRFQEAALKYGLRFVTLVMIGVAVYEYKPITVEMQGLTAKMFPPKPMISSDQQAKINVVNQLAQSREKAVDDVMH